MATLADVKVGGKVWMDVSFYGAEVSTELRTISHVDKNGRLYICADSLIGQWRYGFDPKTGKAQQYRNYTMRYASPEEIEAEEARIAEIDRLKSEAEAQVATEERICSAAPRLLELLRYGVSGYCPSCGCDLANTAGCQWCNWIQNGRALLAEVNGGTYQRPPMLPADEINKRNQAFKVS